MFWPLSQATRSKQASGLRRIWAGPCGKSARPAQQRSTAGLPPCGFSPDKSSSAAEAAAEAYGSLPSRLRHPSQSERNIGTWNARPRLCARSRAHPQKFQPEMHSPRALLRTQRASAKFRSAMRTMRLMALLCGRAAEQLCSFAPSASECREQIERRMTGGRIGIERA
jgi:hypothetical protein